MNTHHARTPRITLPPTSTLPPDRTTRAQAPDACRSSPGVTTALLAAALSLIPAVQASIVTFAPGPNQFSMEFVTIGNPGNAADFTGNTSQPAAEYAGSVGYVYGIGKFEVSRGMIDTYNTAFGTANSLGITLFDMSSLGGNGADKPATGITWNEAARFVNWLNTSTGGHAAYKFAAGGTSTNLSLWTPSDVLDYDPNNPFRSKRATYALPDYDEWYKAAYYNPSNSTYYDYANGSNIAPAPVSSGTTSNTAVYTSSPFSNYYDGPAIVTSAGGLSPYGVMGLGGNVQEWNEDTFEFDYDPAENRILRGGVWYSGSNFLATDSFSAYGPNSTSAGEGIGFRVVALSPSSASVPEPTSLVNLGLGALLIALLRGRFGAAKMRTTG